MRQLAAALGLFFVVNTAAKAQASSEPPAVIENVPYERVNGSDLLLDVFEPAGGPARAHPGVILIHGGSWSSLDKSTMRTMAQFLARSGFVAFAVDYRLFDGKQNGWPAQLDDVQRAVRWIRANAAKYGVEPDHIGAFGHSAGAQLAALLGVEDTRDNSDPALAKYSSKVQAVVDVSGPVNFLKDHDADGVAFEHKFFGKDQLAAASPITLVSKTNAPFLIVHGTRDEMVPITQSEEFYNKLIAAGVPAKLVKVDDVHTFQTPEARRKLAVQTLEFFTFFLEPAQ